MKKFNDTLDIELFPHLIQIILEYRLSSQNTFRNNLKGVIEKLETKSIQQKHDLNFGIQTISELHIHSKYKVSKMLEKHFSQITMQKYCIHLEIFEFYNKKQQQIICLKKQNSKILEKWVFSKQYYRKTQKAQFSPNFNQSDLVLKVLNSLCQKNFEHQQENNKQQYNRKNTTLQKGYQIIIKCKCSKNLTSKIYVLHHERTPIEICQHKKRLKQSLIDFEKYWEKTVIQPNYYKVSIGFYFIQPMKNYAIIQNEGQHIQILSHPNRKLSSETKAQQKEKDSTSSFKLSFEGIFSALSGKQQRNSSRDMKPNRKSTGQPTRHRPRYQSIYQSKDEQLDVFILSPRKLSQEESPKGFQQKAIQFEMNDQKYGRGISQEMIQQLNLQPEDNKSDPSSEGFQMLEENDQLDSIKQQKKKENGWENKEKWEMEMEKEKAMMEILRIQSEMCDLVKSKEFNKELVL